MILVDKPAGLTSHDAVAGARRMLGERRIGHTGTLDPFATGLLVMLLGRATRLAPYVHGEPKVYEATIRFGCETDSDDATGAPTRSSDPPTDDAIRAGVATLTGKLEQIPPSYSAKQVSGRRAYRAARQGAPLDLAPAPVVVHGWEVGERHGADLPVTITCSGGTYIRALARDLGRLTRSAAHLAALRRIRSGVFSVGDATPLATLGHDHVRPPLTAVGALPVAQLGPDGVLAVLRGRAVQDAATIDARTAALVDEAGELVAVAVRDGERWQPRVVLRDA